MHAMKMHVMMRVKHNYGTALAKQIDSRYTVFYTEGYGCWCEIEGGIDQRTSPVRRTIGEVIEDIQNGRAPQEK